jgi:hypothetical protein
MCKLCSKRDKLVYRKYFLVGEYNERYFGGVDFDEDLAYVKRSAEEWMVDHFALTPDKVYEKFSGKEVNLYNVYYQDVEKDILLIGSRSNGELAVYLLYDD